ncbi:Circadian input kinase A [hydrothermal vent metagenome]|uniref:histidine kinase n=1 Tax=hydrothermal vent metagenome TaxID=652676 RepID=A0A3B1A576_9ZZZZ
MKRDRRSTYFLILGFGVIGAFFFIFASGWIYTLYDSQQKLQKILDEKEEEKLVTELKNISLKRNMAVLRVIIKEDVFERDYEKMHMRSLGADFIRIREKLHSEYFRAKEKKYWKSIGDTIDKSAGIQYRIFDLLADGQEKDAILLINDLFKAQENTTQALYTLTALVEEDVIEDLAEAREASVFFSYLVFILLILSVITGFFVIRYVVTKMWKSEDALIDYGRKIRELYDISSESGVDNNIQIEHMLVACCQLINMDNVLVVKVDVISNHNDVLYELGNKLDDSAVEKIKSKLCSFTFHTNNIITIPDFSRSLVWKDDLKLKKSVNASISVPFRVNNSSYGVLCFLKKDKLSDKFTNEESDLIKLVSSWIGFSIEREIDNKNQQALKEKAELANIAKSEFLGNMSHELRTPMHAILSYSGFGVKRFSSVTDDKKLGYFTKIQASAETLLRLLNDILDLSKLEANKMEFDIEKDDINKIILEVIDEFFAMAEDNRLIFECALKESAYPLKFDTGRIKQVIRNLVSNAIKFSKQETSIIIQAENIGTEFKFSIIDKGVGIPSDELLDVFEKFKQSSKTKTEAGGTGLGLAICKEIILAHKGEIWAENNAAGGATFNFSIPTEVANNECK